MTATRRSPVRKLASASRQQRSGTVHHIRCLRNHRNGFLKLTLFRKELAAVPAARQVRLKRSAFFSRHFIARKKHQQRPHVAAIHLEVACAHRSSPSSRRNFRVALNSEFFTVSSVVPSASPIARSFSP